ncbi:MAG: carbon monoxide dehydrogenase subunit G [Alphaproteobacteria bacterium]|nr:carbon monoxide dehydrogenase subunit G [Alphaproteobacteria bacterium]MBO6864713.1 carbon monoxide dehydrogenase subunit G [Alphaproteobacteria bacterium]
MDMQGEYRIPASRETVWDALNDPEVLKACIAGCESLERTEDGGFEATVKAKVGPVKATFKGAVRLENVNPPESYTIVGEGKGGAAGFAKGGADVKLTEDEGETILNYTVNAQVGGKLAQIGARLVDSTAKKYATDFFEKFVEIVNEREAAGKEAVVTEDDSPAPSPQLEAEQAPPPPEAPASESTDDTPQPTMTETRDDIARAAIDAVDATKAKRKGMSPFQWILLLVAILAGLTLLFGGGGPMTGTGG